MTHHLDHWTRVAVGAAMDVTLPLRVHTSEMLPRRRRVTDHGGHIDNVRVIRPDCTVYDWGDDAEMTDPTELPDDAA